MWRPAHSRIPTQVQVKHDAHITRFCVESHCRVCVCVSAATAAVGVARAYGSVCLASGLVGGCPTPVAPIMRIECDSARLLAALDACATLVTNNSHEVIDQVEWPFTVAA